MRRKKGKIKKLFFGTGIFFLCYGPVSPGGGVGDRVVAVVNQEVITFSEIEKWSRPFQQEIQAEDRLERRERIQEVFRKVLDRIIEEKLIEQEARKSGIKVTSKEIEGAVEEVKEKKNFNQYRVNESYRPAHILFLILQEATPEQIRGIRKKSQKVLERIKEGADFAKMAMEYSEDTSSSKEGGDLGHFKKGELLPALEKEAMRLQVGEVSGLIRTELGFHILKLLDRKGGEPPPFEEIKEKVQVDYYEKELEKAFQH